jgi:hypothetical protein
MFKMSTRSMPWLGRRQVSTAVRAVGWFSSCHRRRRVDRMPQRSVVKKAYAGVVGFIAVLLLTGATSNGCTSASGGGGYNADKATAIGACENSVKKQLKAPATADFSNEHATKVGNDEYDIGGDVDAENSFAAKLRTSWTCVAKTDDGGDTWHGLATLDEP